MTKMRKLIDAASLCAIMFGCSYNIANAQDSAVKASTNRIALLIGNDRYKQLPTAGGTQGEFALKPLTNACRDVERISAELERAGWDPEKEIITDCNKTTTQMWDTVNTFRERFFDHKNSLGFIYYAGHGVAVDNETYLFGIDSKISIEKVSRRRQNHPNGRIFDGALRLHADIISSIGDAGQGSLFIAIDACRETPLDTHLMMQAETDPAILKNWRPASTYSAPQIGIKILYSTSYGSLASDGSAGSSPFAASFVEMMVRYRSIHEIVGAVVGNVVQRTRLSKIKQRPEVAGELNPPPPVPCLVGC